jgi:hypothetical protein
LGFGSVSLAVSCPTIKLFPICYDASVMVRGSFFALFVVACSGQQSPALAESSPGLVFPTPIAEGKGDSEAPAPAPKPSAAPPPSAVEAPPDPEPLRQREQYEYTFAYQNGRLSVTNARAVTYAQPIVTARRMGRFAVELWVGKELIERVRFDFPLVAAEEPEKAGAQSLRSAPSLTSRSTFTAVVLVPQSSRARRAIVIDRATGHEEQLPFPP